MLYMSPSGALPAPTTGLHSPGSVVAVVRPKPPSEELIGTSGGGPSQERVPVIELRARGPTRLAVLVKKEDQERCYT